MIITIRAGVDLNPFGSVELSCINIIHKTERTRMIKSILIIGKWTVLNTYINEIVEEIVIIADEMGLLNEIQLERYDKADLGTKIIYFSGVELYDAVIKFGFSVV